MGTSASITAKILAIQLHYPSVDINPHTFPSAKSDTISPICRTYDESLMSLKSSDQRQSFTIDDETGEFSRRTANQKAKTFVAKPTAS